MWIQTSECYTAGPRVLCTVQTRSMLTQDQTDTVNANKGMHTTTELLPDETQAPSTEGKPTEDTEDKNSITHSSKRMGAV